MNRVVRVLKIVWAGPWTLVGLAFGLAGLLTGGRVRRTAGILEFWGGAIVWWLRIQPATKRGAGAMTIGHVVLGRSSEVLDNCRAHELVHVRQYERWGPFFIPAYFAASLLALLQGRHFYRDNLFEREAFNQDN